MLDGSAIDANDYTSTARFVYNANFYLEPTIEPAFDWTVEKALLDLSLIYWDYEEPFEFGVVNGELRKYSVEMAGLPDYLADKVNYVTTFNGAFITGGASNSGNYTTTCSINSDKISQNYVLGDWPEEVPNSINWQI